ncbi:MAG TPA: VCBS repeat-containing protein, partial [Planctomycetes bacterium]|nr:VCBS repeat-containing protein [Planctomycetota bacterium]
DMTGSVFGDVPRFTEDFLRGIPEHRYHSDTLAGNHISGMQGMALGDVNGDGLEDLYVVQPGGLMNRLFLHLPDGSVKDISLESGLAFRNGGRSALFFDMDNDGDQDLAVSFVNFVLIAFNRGDGTFQGQTTLKLPGAAGIYSMSVADPDQDGDLDLYCGRYSYNPTRLDINSPPLPYHDAQNGPPNVFWRQEEPGVFVDATAEVGLDQNNNRYTYATIWDDIDDDGDVDLYVANDFGRNNLYRNDGGRFRDVAAEAGAEDRSSGMGVTAGDYDGDGDIDLFISNMFSSAGQRIVPQYGTGVADDALIDDHLQFAVGSTLLANRGDGTFENVSREAGVQVAGWAWGAKFLDIDNDGWPDIYSPNGYITNKDSNDL